jgi:hypothetical protein
MNALLLSLTLLSPAQDPEIKPPDPERVERAIEELSKAFSKKSDSEAKMQAIILSSEVLHPKVIEWIAKGLKDEDPEVRAATIESLRFMEHPDANDVLVTTLRRDKKLRKNPELYEALIKAVCQHADPKAFSLIADFKLNDETHATIRARIYGIARYRTPESVEELFDVMKRFGKNRAQPYMGELSTALMVLTGVDKGKSQVAWTKWWNDNKRGIEISPELPKLPKKTLYSWSRYWGLELPEERRKRRDERGDDPEGDGPRKKD